MNLSLRLFLPYWNTLAGCYFPAVRPILAVLVNGRLILVRKCASIWYHVTSTTLVKTQCLDDMIPKTFANCIKNCCWLFFQRMHYYMLPLNYCQLSHYTILKCPLRDGTWTHHYPFPESNRSQQESSCYAPQCWLVTGTSVWCLTIFKHTSFRVNRFNQVKLSFLLSAQSNVFEYETLYRNRTDFSSPT